MNPTADLERLISRYLDNEATPVERRALEERLRRDPRVRDLMAQTAAVDLAVGQALHRAMGRRADPRPRPSAWARVGPAGLLAAACLVLLLWAGPPRESVGPDSAPSARAGFPSWFTPPAPPRADVLRRVDPSYERPRERWQITDRDWIVVPGERPGEYFLIELDRVRTCAVVIESDF